MDTGTDKTNYNIITEIKIEIDEEFENIDDSERYSPDTEVLDRHKFNTEVNDERNIEEVDNKTINKDLEKIDNDSRSIDSVDTQLKKHKFVKSDQKNLDHIESKRNDNIKQLKRPNPGRHSINKHIKSPKNLVNNLDMSKRNSNTSGMSKTVDDNDQLSDDNQHNKKRKSVPRNKRTIHTGSLKPKSDLSDEDDKQIKKPKQSKIKKTSSYNESIGRANSKPIDNDDQVIKKIKCNKNSENIKNLDWRSDDDDDQVIKIVKPNKSSQNDKNDDDDDGDIYNDIFEYNESGENAKNVDSNKETLSIEGFHNFDGFGENSGIFNNSLVVTKHKKPKCTMDNIKYTPEIKKAIIRQMKQKNAQIVPDTSEIKEAIMQQMNQSKNALKITKIQKPKNNFYCEECDRHFTKIHNFNSHMRAHKKIKPGFRCMICNIIFIRKFNLDRHINSHHIGNRDYECNVCKNKFAEKGDLQRHVLAHSEERKFACSLCDLKFSRKDALQRHARTHTGEKRFECSTCNKKFTERDNLTKHLKRFPTHVYEPTADGMDVEQKV